MADDWEELITARDENRYELHLNGNTVSKRLEKQMACCRNCYINCHC